MKTRSMPKHFLFCLILWLPGAVQAQPSGLLVNSVELSLQQLLDYQIQLPAGRYWYDPASGLWGQEGGPFLGQINPNLALGGTLRADASGGTTGVFINGRELPIAEVEYLMLVFGGQIPLGRYWLNYDGAGGSEGGPQTFSLAEEESSESGSGSGKVFEDEMADFCAQNGGCPW